MKDSKHSVNNKSRYQKKDNGMFLKITGITIGILIAIAIIISLLRGCESDKPIETTDDTIKSGIVYDNDAVQGGWDKTDADRIIANLNEKVEEGMMNISCNTAPNFANGTSAGNLMIVNENINRYPQVVEITRNDTGEIIYRSGAIPVGSKIESAKLNVDLDKGVYECTAMFYNVDPNSGAHLGCAGAIIHITVLE